MRCPLLQRAVAAVVVWTPATTFALAALAATPVPKFSPQP
jgi:hypothetical protein